MIHERNQHDERPRDAVVGENVERLRGRMSQRALASAMTDRGHKWSQTTVTGVEKGRRPLRLVEACDLAALFRCDLLELVVDRSSAGPAKKIADMVRDVREAALRMAEVETAMNRVIEDVEDLSSTRPDLLLQTDTQLAVITLKRASRAAVEAASRAEQMRPWRTLDEALDTFAHVVLWPEGGSSGEHPEAP